MAWIRTIREDQATDFLKEQYDQAIKRAGRVYEILKIQSLRSEYIAASIALYEKAMFGPSKLTRVQREMMAVVVGDEQRFSKNSLAVSPRNLRKQVRLGAPD